VLPVLQAPRARPVLLALLPRLRVLPVPQVPRAPRVLLLRPWVPPGPRARPVPRARQVLPAPPVQRVLPARPTPPTVAEQKLALRNAGVM